MTKGGIDDSSMMASLDRFGLEDLEKVKNI